MMIISAIVLGLLGLFFVMACSAEESFSSPAKYIWKVMRAVATNDKCHECKGALTELFFFYILWAFFSGFAFLILLVISLMMKPTKLDVPFTCTNKEFVVIQQVGSLLPVSTPNTLNSQRKNNDHLSNFHFSNRHPVTSTSDCW